MSPYPRRLNQLLAARPLLTNDELRSELDTLCNDDKIPLMPRSAWNRWLRVNNRSLWTSVEDIFCSQYSDSALPLMDLFTRFQEYVLQHRGSTTILTLNAFRMCLLCAFSINFSYVPTLCL